MNRIRSVIAPLVLLALLVSIAPAQEAPSSEPQTEPAANAPSAPASDPAKQPTNEQLLARAESAVAQAEDTVNPTERAALFDEAIAAYRALLDRGVSNASIHRNIGSVQVLKGDLGRAVVSLRRADRIDPSDPRVTDTLHAARRLVRAEVSPGVRTRAMDALFFWRGHVPRSALLWTGIGAWAVLWLALTLRLVRGRGPRLNGTALACVAGVVCLLAAGSLLGERMMFELNPAAVVVGDSVTGYRGPSEGVYEPTFNEPLRAGVEGAVLEQRDGWVRLRLRSGSETWVPESSVEMV